MYLVLRPPWGGGASTASPGAGVVAAVPVDAGTAKPKKKKRLGGGGGHTPGRTNAGPDFEPGGDEPDEPGAPTIMLTAADRALEWRGDATSISRKIDINSGEDARPLQDSEINSAVSGQTGGVRQCVVQGATGTNMTATTITVKIVVEGTGKVSKSQLQAPHYLFEKGLLGCAQRALGQMKFPATGAPTLVTFPINLT